MAVSKVSRPHYLLEIRGEKLTLRISIPELVFQGLAFALGERPNKSKCLRLLLALHFCSLQTRPAYVLTSDGVDDIVRRGSEEFCDDGELVDVVLSGEQRLALEHLGKDAAGAPYVNLNIVLLPREHDLRSAVVPG